MARLVVVLRGLAAVLVLIALLAGVPALLVAVAGWPLPTAIPSLEAVGDALTRTGIQDTTIVKAIAVVVWLAWLQLAVSVTIEVFATARRRPSRSVPATLPPLRHLAASLVTAATALGGSFGAHPAGAVEPPRLATVLVLPLAGSDDPHHDVGTAGEQVASAERMWTVQRGDTLSAIAERVYGDPAQWTRLWHANRGRLLGDRSFDDPNLIFAGWELVVPAHPAPAPPIAPPVAPPTPVARLHPATTTSLSPPSSVALVETARDGGPRSAGPGAAVAPRTASGEVGTGQPVAAAATSASTATSGWTIATGLAGAALLATGVTGLVSSRRRRRLERLEPGQEAPAADEDLVPIERAVRCASDPLAVARLDVALRALAALTRDDATRSVRPVAVWHRRHGDLEVTLAEPVTPARPWTSTDGGRVWRLDAAVPLQTLATLGAGVTAPCPALVALGQSDGDVLYLDLEAAGTVALAGPPEHARAIARAVVASLAVSPLAERVHVVAAGVDCYGFANERRVRAVPDARAALDEVRTLAGPLPTHLAGAHVTSTFALRAARPAELWEPVVVVALTTNGDGDAAALQALREHAQPGGRAVALLTDQSGPGATWQLEAGSKGWRLEPLAVTIEPRGLAADELADLGALLADAGAPLAPVSQVASRPTLRAEGGHGPSGVTSTPFVEQPWRLLVRVLGPVDVVDAAGRPATFERSKALELVVWLAEHREHPTRSAARAALWETDVRDATFANVVSDARRALARHVPPPPQQEWIGRTYAEDLPLHELVVTDVELLDARLTYALGQDAAGAVVTLREGLANVRDLPFAATSYLWPDSTALPSHHTVLVVKAATELATRYLELGDADGVFWATAQGLKALPAHDGLVCLRMRAHALQGDFAGVRQEYASYERTVTADPWGDGAPSPKVVDLRRSLVRPAT